MPSNYVTAQSPFHKHRNDSTTKGFIFSCVLPTGVTIASVAVPSISTLSGTSSTALTVTGETPNAAAFEDDEGNEVAIANAVQALVAGGTTGCRYRVTMVTTGDDGETYAGDFEVEVY